MLPVRFCKVGGQAGCRGRGGRTSATPSMAVVAPLVPSARAPWRKELELTSTVWSTSRTTNQSTCRSHDDSPRSGHHPSGAGVFSGWRSHLADMGGGLAEGKKGGVDKIGRTKSCQTFLPLFLAETVNFGYHSYFDSWAVGELLMSLVLGFKSCGEVSNEWCHIETQILCVFFCKRSVLIISKPLLPNANKYFCSILVQIATFSHLQFFHTQLSWHAASLNWGEIFPGWLGRDPSWRLPKPNR